MVQGANVFYGRQMGLHVSGHGCQEDQKLMLALTKPKFFIPVHGEYRMLVKHSETAQSVGIPRENMIIINNGDTIELTANGIYKGEKVPSGIELVDTAGIVHNNVMEERERLAEDGVITVATTVDSQGQLLAKPEIHLRGVVCTMEMTSLERLISRTVDSLISDRLRSKLLLEGDENINWTSIRNEVETTLERVIQREINSDPLVIFMLNVQEKTTKLQNSNGNGNGNVVNPNNLDNNEISQVDDDNDLESKFNRRRRSKVNV
jgi:ribonuclease J